MITKEQKSRLTIFLVVSSILLVGILGIFIMPKLQKRGDMYYIDFENISVNGVFEGSDVKYQGVRIGKVGEMTVLPEDLSTIRVYVILRKGFPVKENMRARLQYAGITGLRFVEISGGKTASNTMEPGSEIKMAKGLGEKAEDIVLNVDTVVNAVNEILKPENQVKITSMLANIEKTTGVLARVLEKREKNLDNFLRDMDRTSRELTKISKNLAEFTERMNTLSEEMQLKELLTNTHSMVNNISARFSEKELGKVVTDFDTFVTSTTSSVKKIESSLQELQAETAKTMESLREAVENISSFTRELTEDPTILIRTKTDKRRKR